MAKKAMSSRTSKDLETTSAAGAAVAARSKDARKPIPSGTKPAARKKPASVPSAAHADSAKASKPPAKAARTASGRTASKATGGGKSSIASKVVEGLKATATGALGAVSLAAQALTSEKKPGRRK